MKFFSQWFTLQELQCHDCGKCEMDEGFINLVDQAREECNFPWIIRSGYRCANKDILVGGEGNHPQGKALDIKFHSSHELFLIIESCRKREVTRFGIKFESVNPTKGFIHIDTCQNRPQRVMWGYK